jgi:group I intron endonuclease
MKPPTTFIYTLTDPRTGFVRYVGKADNLKARYNRHLKAKGISHRTCWIKRLQAEGMRPRLEILEEVPQVSWQDAERFWISYLKFLGFQLTNLTDGGEGVVDSLGLAAKKISRAMKGRKFTVEHRAKLSAAKLGRKTGPCSEERRARIRAALKGKTVSIEQRMRISATLKGRKASPETRAKISAAATGRKMSEAFCAKISARCKGKPLSKAHRAKLSESHKGLRRSEEAKRKTTESLLWSHALRRAAKRQPGGGIGSVAEIRVGKKTDNVT